MNTQRILILILSFPVLSFGQVRPVFKQQKPNTIKRPVVISINKEADKEEEAEIDEERQGPANTPFQIFDQISSDHEFEVNSNILNIFRNVYRDANPNSGYFYYLPAEFNLNWIEDREEYAFYVNYLEATAQGRGEAVITAELKPNITRRDVELAGQLLDLEVKSDPVANKFPVNKLASMPLAAPPTINFSQIRNYGVNPEDIIVRTPTDFLDPIVISWRMANVDGLLTALFNNVGLNGNLRLEPAGVDMPPIEIPITLKIDDPKTFGNIDIEGNQWRNSGWQNKTDYPVKLKNLHVMMFKTAAGKKRPRIFTWRAGSTEIPEKATAKFDASLVPSWLENNNNVKKIWMEYVVEPCNSCNAEVRRKILGGVSSSQITEIEVTTLSPLAFTGAQMMKIRLRSIQADPNGLNKVNMGTLTITQDFQTLNGGQLFFDEGEKPDFEFMISVYMPDGTRHEMDNWKRSNEMELVVGEAQIKELISHFR